MMPLFGKAESKPDSKAWRAAERAFQFFGHESLLCLAVLEFRIVLTGRSC